MTAYAVLVFLLAVLFGLQAIGTAVFLIILMTGSQWWINPVGRHLAFYGGALFALYLTSTAMWIWPNTLTFIVLVSVHALFATAVWHRVYLVIKEQRSDASSSGGSS